MSRETSKDDLRKRTDQKSHKQSDEPWKGPIEKEQKPSDVKPDLEKWQRTDTH